MYPTRLFHLLLVAFGFIAVAQAAYPHEGRLEQRNSLRRRQDDASPPASDNSPPPTPTGTDDDDDDDDDDDGPTSETEPTTEPTTTPTTTTTTPTTTDEPTTESEPDTSPTPSPPPSAPPTRTSSTTTTSTTSTADNNNDDDDKDDNDNGGQTPTSRTSPTSAPEPTTSIITSIIYTTNSDGQVSSMTSEIMTTHTPADLVGDGSDNGGGGGMPTKDRNILIGVVVGVGGAIVLGALAFVGWRLWGRKKRNDENDHLMDYTTAGTSAFNNDPKTDAMAGSPATAATGPGRTPFQTTLENYHQPTQVNASSNF
ncbi:hypothetical protein ACRALDRAFT_1061702 [Sodiomyces alcalophilus JCM 7366]|uniref:uncharacterized protein n=1 Tax=Sodiomyces alcalophilus JCM 7366 TaxID=591952 RepID=UPI0039B37A92